MSDKEEKDLMLVFMTVVSSDGVKAFVPVQLEREDFIQGVAAYRTFRKETRKFKRK